jgi:hypothetical protein
MGCHPLDPLGEYCDSNTVVVRSSVCCTSKQKSFNGDGRLKVNLDKKKEKMQDLVSKCVVWKKQLVSPPQKAVHSHQSSWLEGMVSIAACVFEFCNEDAETACSQRFGAVGAAFDTNLDERRSPYQICGVLIM